MGLSLITYCVMSNHFHVLLEAPCRPSRCPMKVRMQRLESLSGMSQAGIIRQQLETFRRRHQNKAAEEIARTRPGADVGPEHVHETGQATVQQWHNRGQERKGTLWEQRFKSVLVEGRKKRWGR